MKNSALITLLLVSILVSGCGQASKPAVMPAPAPLPFEEAPPPAVRGSRADDGRDDRVAEERESMKIKKRATKDGPASEEITMGGFDAPASKPGEPGGSRGVRGAAAQRQNAPQAGEHDDNEEWNYYIKFLEESLGASPVRDMALDRSLMLHVEDSNGLPLVPAGVKVNDKTLPLYPDGEALFTTESQKKLSLQLTYRGYTTNITLTPRNFREIIKLPLARQALQTIPVDIVFLLDTTGSMGDEIDILRDTLYSIYTRIGKIPAPGLSLRFGMVLYRDTGDEYLTKEFPLTADIQAFQNQLMSEVQADGGGDTPEALLPGLDKTLNGLNWRKDSVKLVFLMTDAPGHMRDLSEMDTLVKKAAEMPARVYSIGASGLDMTGEVQLRALSQRTKGKFIFLTYGETGESSGEATDKDPGKVSHHTGGNYKSRQLDDIVVDNVTAEIANLLPAGALKVKKPTSAPVETDQDQTYRRVDSALFQISKQLGQDSRYKGTNTVLVLAPDTDDKKLEKLAMHVQNTAEEIMTSKSILKPVDRSKLKIMTDEIKLKLTGLTGGDLTPMAKADTILAGKLYYTGENIVLFVRLIDAQTSEVLGAAMVRL